MPSIKLAHAHPENGKTCVVITRFDRDQTGGGSVFGEVVMVEWNSQSAFLAGFYTWTGHWYAYDKDTGENIATFTREFFERHLRPFASAPALPDEECERLANAGAL